MKVRTPKAEPTADVLLVSFDVSNGTDKSVMLIGRKAPGKDVEVINAFQGKEAEELYMKLAASPLNSKDRISEGE